MKTTKMILVVLTIVVCLMRGLLNFHGITFKTSAHAFVFGMIGAWIVLWGLKGFKKDTFKEDRIFPILIVIQIVVEVFAFVKGELQ